MCVVYWKFHLVKSIEYICACTRQLSYTLLYNNFIPLELCEIKVFFKINNLQT